MKLSELAEMLLSVNTSKDAKLKNLSYNRAPITIKSYKMDVFNNVYPIPSELVV
jgi:hypothetical protein